MVSPSKKVKIVKLPERMTATREMYYCIYDTEATDKDPASSDIIAFACILCRITAEGEWVEIGRFNSLVYTTKRISPGASENAHGIYQKDLEGEDPLPKVMDRLVDWFERMTPPDARITFMGHNIKGYDNIIMFTNFVQRGMDLDEFFRKIRCVGFEDTLQIIRIAYKDVPKKFRPKKLDKKGKVTDTASFALGGCFKFFTGKDPVGAHDALEDCLFLFHIFNTPEWKKMVPRSLMSRYFFNRDTGINLVRQSSASFFKDTELAAREAALAQEDLYVVKKGTKGNQSMSDKPFFKVGSGGMIWCCNCMSRVQASTHTRCNLAPKALAH